MTFVAAALALVCALHAGAATIPIPDAPPPEFVDRECVTNVPLRATTLQRARVFEGSLSIFATASNSVEIAFGAARNGDGVLLPGDEQFAFGWDGGAWFLSFESNRVTSADLSGSERRSLSFTMRISEGGAPKALQLSASGAADAFAAMARTPPDSMFSRYWDTVRLTVRGVDDPQETAFVRFDNDPGIFLMR